MIHCTPKTGTKINKENMKTGATDIPVKGSTADFRAQAPKAGPAPIIKIGKSEEFSLDNGLKVIVVENHKIPRVSYQVLIDIEAWKEGDKAGLGDIAGDLLTRGTTNRTKAEIDEAIDFIGANIGSGATSLYGSALTKHSDSFLEVYSDVLLNPAFPQKEFDKIVKLTASNLASSKDDASQITSDVSSVVNFGKNHPYGEVLTEASLAKITVADCKAFMNKYWNPAQAYLVMVGDINLASAKMLAEKYFGSWKKKPNFKMASFPQPEFPTSRTVDFVNKAGAVQSVVNLTYPLNMPMGSPDRTAASVLNSILGGYFQSRINQNLRETHGYTYGARSSINSDAIIAQFSAMTSVRNEVTDSAIVELLFEVQKLRQELVGEKELDMVKNVLAGSFGRRLENPSNVATFALNKSRYNYPEDYYDTYLDRLSKVTAADVKAMAQKYLTPNKAHLVVVGSKSEVADKLKKFATDGKINFYNTEGEPIVTVDEELSISIDEILENYLQALGGPEAIGKINSFKTVMTSDFQGMTLEMTSNVTNKEQLRVEMTIGGNPMQTQIYNSGKASMEAMGQKMPADEGIINELKYAAHPVPEFMYKTWGVKGAIEGVEEINGEQAYTVIWKAPEGRTWTEYYSKTSGLKLRVVTQMEASGQKMTQTIDLGDYKTVEGILFAHKSSLSGAGMPGKIEMDLKSVELNVEPNPSLFEIN